MESEMNCLFVGCKMWVIIDAKGKSRGLNRGKLTCRVLSRCHRTDGCPLNLLSSVSYSPTVHREGNIISG